MNTINIAADATAQRIGIGNQYENEATAVVFDCSQFAEDHGAGTAQIIHRRPTESIGYVCTNVSQTGSTVTWLVTDDDTSFTGKGQVQLRWYVNDVLRESVIFPTYILPSVASSDDAPAEVKSALERLMEWVNDNTISIEDLDERIANYFDEHPIPTPVTSVNEKLGDVVLTAEDVGAYSTEEADEKFCVPDGEYEELNAGTSKQLLSDSYTLDQVPYLYRKSPDSDRAVEEIVGGTVGWNQMVVNGNFESTSGWAPNSANITASNNILTMQATEQYGSMAHSFTWTEGHKYLLCMQIKGDSAFNAFQCYTSSGVYFASPSITTSWSAYGSVANYNKTAKNRVLTFQDNRASNWDNVYIKNVILTDLTTMFGSTIADYIYSLETANAGAGVSKLKEWGFFTEDYYEYCEPTLRSVEGLQSKKTVGFNQWDEEWRNGYYDTLGVYHASGNYLANKNYIKVLPNTNYNIASLSKKLGRVCWYDADYNFISTTTPGGAYTSVVIISPQGAKYMAFDMGSGYGTTYNHDICINLSDPTRNGQYEPYESHTYSLDSEVVLRGVPKLDSNNNLYFDGDIYPADGQGKRRYGLVDLGSLIAWTANGEDSVYHAVPNRKTGSQNGISSALIQVDSSVASNVMPNMTFKLSTTTNSVIVKVSGINTSNAESMLSGIYLLYELATPTTFTAQPYHNPQIVGDTEEFVTTGIVPVGHSTRYYQNLRKKIEGLPWNFSSLIAPTEVTNKATRNYTAGSYLILNNTLYKVTANIANGGTISPNSNVTATTIMTEIMSL